MTNIKTAKSKTLLNKKTTLIEWFFSYFKLFFIFQGFKKFFRVGTLIVIAIVNSASLKMTYQGEEYETG